MSGELIIGWGYLGEGDPVFKIECRVWGLAGDGMSMVRKERKGLGRSRTFVMRLVYWKGSFSFIHHTLHEPGCPSERELR